MSCEIWPFRVTCRLWPTWSVRLERQMGLKRYQKRAKYWRPFELWCLFRPRTFHFGISTFTVSLIHDAREISTGELLRPAVTYLFEIQSVVAQKNVKGRENMTWLSRNAWWLTRIVIHHRVSTPHHIINPSDHPVASSRTQPRCQISSQPLTFTCRENFKTIL